MKKLLYIIIPTILLASCSNEPEFKVDAAKNIENVIDTHKERVSEIENHTALLFSDSLNFNVKSANDLLAV